MTPTRHKTLHLIIRDDSSNGETIEVRRCADHACCTVLLTYDDDGSMLEHHLDLNQTAAMARELMRSHD